MNALVPVVPQFSMGDIKQIAQAIAEGGLFGSKDPYAVLTLCLLAQAEGQHPAVVFRDYHIIQGRPAKKADAMLRDFINAGGKVEWHTLDDERVDATFSHPSGEARIDWTLDRARQAGIANPMWKKYPRQMLRSRVISEGVRTVYPGATSGLYEIGEVQDIAAETIDGGGVRSEPLDKAPSGGAVGGNPHQSAENSMPDEEYNRLVGKSKAAGINPAALARKYKVADLRLLDQDQYANAIAGLDKTIADKAKAATNKSAEDFGKELLDDEIPY